MIAMALSVGAAIGAASALALHFTDVNNLNNRIKSLEDGNLNNRIKSLEDDQSSICTSVSKILHIFIEKFYFIEIQHKSYYLNHRT